MRYFSILFALVILLATHPASAQILFGRLAVYEVDFDKMVHGLTAGSKDPNRNNVGRWFANSMELYYLTVTEGTKAGRGTGPGLLVRFIYNGSWQIRPQYVWAPAYLHKKLLFRTSVGPTFNVVRYRRFTGTSGYFNDPTFDRLTQRSIGFGISLGMRMAKSRFKVPIDYTFEYQFTPSDSKYASDKHQILMSFALGITLLDRLE